jgi:hypothetical protein
VPGRELLRQTPRSFRGEQPRGYPEPGGIEEYKSRSVLEEHKGLAIVFGILFLALAAYFIKSVLTAPKPSPPAPQSVYIEVVPTPPAPTAP